MSNVVSLNKSEDYRDLFKKNYDFFNNMENYERNIMLSLENIYDNQDYKTSFSRLINEERKTDSWVIASASCMGIALFSLLLVVIHQEFFMIPVALIFPLISIHLWKEYKSPENSKTMVLGRVLSQVLKQDILEADYLPALKEAIREEKMIELIKKYEEKIPIIEVLENVKSYFHDFREYKAHKIYSDINNK